jgi:hypothetical protein
MSNIIKDINDEIYSLVEAVNWLKKNDPENYHIQEIEKKIQALLTHKSNLESL